MEKIEQVMNSDGTAVANLYRRTYVLASGKKTVHYFTKFVDWQGIRRTFSLGDTLSRAKSKVQGYRDDNRAEVDFDKLKVDRAARGMTFSKWAAERRVDADKFHVAQLERYFGDKRLSDIDDDTLTEYRQKRSAEKIVRHGKLSKKTVSQTTINKELSTLRKLLRMARKKGIHDKVTVFPMEKEPSRKRTLTPAEYKKLVDKCPTWLKRVVVMAYETSLSRSDLFELTWQEIDTQRGFIERDRNKTDEYDAQHTIPIVTAELWDLITELQAERRRVPNVEGLVFTMNGQPIPKNLFEYWFRASCKRAGVKNFRFHDLRHCAISRWAAAGIPTAAAMKAAGHKSVASHKKYQNLQNDELKNAFRNLSRKCPDDNEQEREKAVSD
jgi:integrase